MDKCSFCGNQLSPGTGLTFIKKDSRIFHFCSKKCEKNLFKLNRKPREIRWTSEYRKEKVVRVTTSNK